jgi:hypothetical protein
MVNENKYNGLKPGQYIQIGDSIKSVTSFAEWLGSGGNSKTPSAEMLAASVSWAYIALDKRRNQIQQTPVVWQRGEVETDEPQLGFAPVFELPRTDKAIQLNYSVYYHKLRNGGGRFVGLRWLDPALIQPDEDSVEGGVYTRYVRTINGVRTAIPGTDILRIYIPGLREMAPDNAASTAASLDSQIALGMSKTLDSFFATGGLPVLFIDVPGNPPPGMVERLIEKWGRILRREGDGENKIIATTGGITVTTISLSPEQLDTTSISRENAAAITATYGVPLPLALGQAVNETTLVKLATIFASDILGRINLIISQINNDPDIMKTGFSLVAHPDRMEIFQLAELVKAEALQRLVQGPIMSANEAREDLGLEPLPGHDDLVMVQSPIGRLPQPAAPTPEPDTKSMLWLEDSVRLDKYIADGQHKKRIFKSNELTADDIRRRIEVNEIELVKSVYP